MCSHLGTVLQRTLGESGLLLKAASCFHFLTQLYSNPDKWNCTDNSCQQKGQDNSIQTRYWPSTVYNKVPVVEFSLGCKSRKVMFMGLWSTSCCLCRCYEVSVGCEARNFLKRSSGLFTMVLYSLSLFSTSASWWIFLHWWKCSIMCHPLQ